MKGQPKENAREKKERKKEFRENKDKVWTVALPTFGVIFLLIAVSVYLSTRPKSVPLTSDAPVGHGLVSSNVSDTPSLHLSSVSVMYFVDF